MVFFNCKGYLQIIQRMTMQMVSCYKTKSSNMESFMFAMLRGLKNYHLFVSYRKQYIYNYTLTINKCWCENVGFIAVSIEIWYSMTNNDLRSGRQYLDGIK